jgi:hypothetical protein
MCIVAIKQGETGRKMSDEGDTFWISLAEKLFGVLLIVVGGLMLYFTATTSDLGAFSIFFGILSVIVLIIGLFLLLVKAPE